MSGDRLFTPRFFVMCGFTFTVFLSAFQLLPTAPFHIRDMGGTKLASGLFLGFLTYASAFSAPLTGAFADRIGTRRLLITSSVALCGFSLVYAVLESYHVLLALVVIHGIFWSGLLSASAAHMTHMLPEHRRAEGIGYWGLASVAAIAVAPSVGFWVYRLGWFWLCMESAALNIVMAAIAWNLQKDRQQLEPDGRPHRPAAGGRVLEWRVLILSFTLFLYSFGYGGITSFAAMYADAVGVTPKGIYLTALAVVILVTRPISGRFGDRWGYARVFIPCLVLITVGLAILAAGSTRGWMLASAIVFGAGYGTAYPVFVGYVMQGVSAQRRGAAFGAILAAFDTGIGTGSTSLGWLIERFGYASAFGVAAALSALALPYFLATDRLLRVSRRSESEPRAQLDLARGGGGGRPAEER
jgi:MFS family permease